MAVFELFKKGQEALKAKGKAAEKEKAGVLRGGNSGLLFENGDAAAHCLAQTWLRFKGIDAKALEADMNITTGQGGRALMFEAGVVNEDSWYATLAASGYQGKILREEDIPVKWTTDAGVHVTGRPDIVLCDEEGKPKTGIELKLVSSVWTARTVLINRKPKMSHLAQVGHYMWQLGVPFELWYTNRTDFEASSDFNLQDYPKYGEPGSELFSYRFYKWVANPANGEFKKSTITERQYNLLKEAGENVEAKVGKYLPFVQGFLLQFDNKGRLWYRDACDPSAEAQLSVVTKDRIKAFYERVATLKQVPKEPVTIKVDGKKENFKLSSYCALGHLCCKVKAGDNIESWTKEVAKTIRAIDPSATAGYDARDGKAKEEHEGGKETVISKHKEKDVTEKAGRPKKPASKDKEVKAKGKSKKKA